MLITPRITEIKDRRERLGLSQHQVSLQAGLAGSSISRIESGETKKKPSARQRNRKSSWL